MSPVETHTELHVQSLWGSVSGVGLHVKCEAEKKKRQTASKATKEFNKTSTFFHEHQSIKTSSSILLFFHPSIHDLSNTHTYNGWSTGTMTLIWSFVITPLATFHIHNGVGAWQLVKTKRDDVFTWFKKFLLKKQLLMAGRIKVTTAMSDHLWSLISPNNRVLVSCLHINLCKCNVSTFFQLLTWDSYLRDAQVLKWISQSCEQPTIAWYFASKTIIVSLNLQDEKVVVFFLPKDLMSTPIILFVYSSELNARKQIPSSSTKVLETQTFSISMFLC